mmetsp:Transcript_1060/g.3089  ORF Transcript_1060/g.3089 Transcript_1060/m.3089 type:complete len:237 (+) Transcript_1060:383-1093(+)
MKSSSLQTACWNTHKNTAAAAAWTNAVAAHQSNTTIDGNGFTKELIVLCTTCSESAAETELAGCVISGVRIHRASVRALGVIVLWRSNEKDQSIGTQSDSESEEVICSTIRRRDLLELVEVAVCLSDDHEDCTSAGAGTHIGFSPDDDRVATDVCVDSELIPVVAVTLWLESDCAGGNAAVVVCDTWLKVEGDCVKMRPDENCITVQGDGDPELFIFFWLRIEQDGNRHRSIWPVE